MNRADFIRRIGTGFLGLTVASASVSEAFAAEEKKKKKTSGKKKSAAKSDDKAETKPAVAKSDAPKTEAKTAAAEQPTTKREPEPEVYGPDRAHKVNSGPGFGRRIALTFDDGPAPGLTDRVLKELAKRNMRATFFCIGQNVARCPTLAKEIVASGNEIANHSYTHPQLSKCSGEKLNDELQRTQEAIATATGVTPIWMRPPYGAWSKSCDPAARSRNLGVAMWSVDPLDWKRPGSDVVVQRIMAGVRPGAIILMHDIHKGTVDCLSDLFDRLQDQGYETATMSNFIGAPYPIG
ncbi:polysaccharide deacetylase [Verrucomicrobia bacterium LW23]|nr:polysaccharide deacetylase [Verrucomicrobia bacterium LW23]